MRNAALATAIALLLTAPASWSFQTLGHATSGTFPAGGPANAGGGFGGPGGGFGGGNMAPPPGANGGGFTPGGTGTGPGRGTSTVPGTGSSGGTGSVPGTGSGGGTIPGGGTGSGGGTGTVPGAGSGSGTGAVPGAGSGSGGAPGGGFGGPGGGAFGGNSASLTTALDYIASHGGGTLAVSSQSTASAAIVSSNAKIVGIGGFSGRESEVSVSWLAQEVRGGNIRWVLADGSGGGGLPSDGRTGSTTAMEAIAATCEPVTVDGVTLYDCQGMADAIAAYA